MYTVSRVGDDGVDVLVGMADNEEDAETLKLVNADKVVSAWCKAKGKEDGKRAHAAGDYEGPSEEERMAMLRAISERVDAELARYKVEAVGYAAGKQRRSA